jgi:hypothetical protein
MAGRPCTVCGHRDRAEIDRQLVAGTALPGISRQFAVSQDSLARHREKHVPTMAMQEGAQAVAAAEGTHGATLLGGACNLRDKALGLLKKAEESGDLRTALMGVREAARCVELMAKLTGDIDESATVNIIANPQFVMVQQAILSALAPHPAARAAVLMALEGVQ